MLVTCGDESDLFVKLWGSGSEPIQAIQTNQIRHKNMAQGVQNDYYAVVTRSSEIKVFQIA